MNAEAIEKLGIEYFYAHSYCSGERGSNENNNKLKGIDIDKIKKSEIKKIELWINNYPRKLFNGKSALEIFNQLSKKIFCNTRQLVLQFTFQKKVY